MAKYAIAWKGTNQMVSLKKNEQFLIFPEQENAMEYLFENFSKKERMKLSIVAVEIHLS